MADLSVVRELKGGDMPTARISPQFLWPADTRKYGSVLYDYAHATPGFMQYWYDIVRDGVRVLGVSRWN